MHVAVGAASAARLYSLPFFPFVILVNCNKSASACIAPIIPNVLFILFARFFLFFLFLLHFRCLSFCMRMSSSDSEAKAKYNWNEEKRSLKEHKCIQLFSRIFSLNYMLSMCVEKKQCQQEQTYNGNKIMSKHLLRACTPIVQFVFCCSKEKWNKMNALIATSLRDTQRESVEKKERKNQIGKCTIWLDNEYGNGPLASQICWFIAKKRRTGESGDRSECTLAVLAVWTEGEMS